VLGVGRDALGRQRSEQLVDQERVAAGDLVARCGERRLGLAAESARRQPAYRLDAEWLRSYHVRVGISAELGECASSSTPGSSVRSVATSSTPTLSTRRARYTRKRSEGTSHHCRSSTRGTYEDGRRPRGRRRLTR
jgi:hypothetical protein